MTLSSSLVPYRPGPVYTMILQHQQPSALISSRFFTQQAGMAIATELLYRILFDIINRLLSSLQRLAAHSMDEASTWLQRKLQERRDAATPDPGESLNIMQEVGQLAEQQGVYHVSFEQARDVRCEGWREMGSEGSSEVGTRGVGGDRRGEDFRERCLYSSTWGLKSG